MFWRACLPEVVPNVGGQAKPRVLSFFIYRVRRCPETWVAKASNGNTAVSRSWPSLPPDRCSTIWAEVKTHSASAIAGPTIDFVDTLLPNLAGRIIGTRVHDSTSTTLASNAVADVDPVRVTCCDYTQLAAVTLCDTFHIRPSLLVGVWGRSPNISAAKTYSIYGQNYSISRTCANPEQDCRALNHTSYRSRGKLLTTDEHFLPKSASGQSIAKRV